MLGNAPVQRERHIVRGLVVGRQSVVVLHHQSSRVHQTAGQPGDQRVVHFQCLNTGPAVPESVPRSNIITS